jgi:hypothetical protein
MSVDLTPQTARVSQQNTLRDEEIGDVSLATFHVFNKESTPRPLQQMGQLPTLMAFPASFNPRQPVHHITPSLSFS